jgi:hypothetical protein
MRFRPTMPGDLDAILAKSAKPYDKLAGPQVPEESITGLDDDGTVRIVVQAEKVAELYLAVDHDWGTPAMRWTMIDLIHAQMLAQLRAKGFQVGYCFFPDGVPNGYIRRLVAKGWNRIVERCVRYATR